MNKLVFLALVLFSGTVFGQINTPTKVDEHKPIIVSAVTPADVYIWSVRKPATRVVVDNGKTLHIWAPPGVYEVSLTTIKVDVKVDPNWKPDSGTTPQVIKDVQYNEHFAEFEVVRPGPPTPKPDDPVPPPVPTAFKQKVSEALKKIVAGIAYKDKVGENYAAVASEAKANPSAWDAAAMVNEVKVRHATVLPSTALNSWSIFWVDLAKAFVELKLDSSDLQGHIKAFEEVAEVLKG